MASPGDGLDRRKGKLARPRRGSSSTSASRKSRESARKASQDDDDDDQDDQSSSAASKQGTPTFPRFGNRLRKTRSSLMFSKSSGGNESSSPQRESTSSTRFTGLMASILSPNGTPPKQTNTTPSKSRTMERVYNYLFDPEAVNDNKRDPIYLMGKQHPPSSASADNPDAWPTSFMRDFTTTIACTYRTQFQEPIPTSNTATTSLFNSFSALSINRQSREGGLSSDTGWGCMLRTGQSLLANALLHLHLGRDWQLPTNGEASTERTDPTYARLVSLFLDSPSCPFSVHRFALMGKQLGKHVGEWFGPSTAAGAIKALVNDYEPAGLKVVHFVDGAIYESDVKNASRDWSTPVLIVMGLRLGINGVNPIYHKSLMSLFTLKQSVGIAGGKPSSSYYFVGAQGTNSLFYIDPHHARPAVPLVPVPSDLQPLTNTVPLSSTSSTGGSDDDATSLDAFYSQAYPYSALESYHVSRVRKTSIEALDPSMLVGFLVRSERSWIDFRDRVRQLGIDDTARGGLFVIQDRPPPWAAASSSSPSSPSSPLAPSDASPFATTTGADAPAGRDSEDVRTGDEAEVESLDSWQSSLDQVEPVSTSSIAAATVPRQDESRDDDESKQSNDMNDDDDAVVL